MPAAVELAHHIVVDQLAAHSLEAEAPVAGLGLLLPIPSQDQQGWCARTLGRAPQDWQLLAVSFWGSSWNSLQLSMLAGLVCHAQHEHRDLPEACVCCGLVQHRDELPCGIPGREGERFAAVWKRLQGFAC